MSSCGKLQTASFWLIGVFVPILPEGIFSFYKIEVILGSKNGRNHSACCVFRVCSWKVKFIEEEVVFSVLALLWSMGSRLYMFGGVGRSQLMQLEGWRPGET